MELLVTLWIRVVHGLAYHRKKANALSRTPLRAAKVQFLWGL